MRASKLILILILAVGSSAYAAKTPAEINKEMIGIYKGWTGKAGAPPSEALEALKELVKKGIPQYASIPAQADTSSKNERDAIIQMKDVVIQEWLRKQIDFGMPWLPLSWSYDGRGATWTDNWNAIARGLENSLSRAGANKDDAILLGYLFNGSIYHTSNYSLVEKFRMAAINALSHDRAFQDLRDKVHDDPSWSTIELLKQYIKTTSNTAARTYAQEAVDAMEAAFGVGSVDEFMRNLVPDASVTKVLNDYKVISAEIKTTAGKSLTDPKKLDAAIDLLGRIAKESTSIREKLEGSSFSCDATNAINCRYKYFDLLKQFQMIVFALGTTIQESAIKNNIGFSVSDLSTLIRAYVASTYSIGLITKSSSQSALAALGQLGDVTSPEKVMIVVNQIEQELGMIRQRLHAMFASTLQPYLPYVPQLDPGWVDDTIRTNSILPFERLLEQTYRVLQTISGKEIRVSGRDIRMPFRILNPGIARGVLVMPTEEEINDPDYIWDPNAIYAFRKTPENMRKVAGILTTDSGSMISHVQLLASNAGIPNVHIGRGLIPVLEKMAGKEVLLISLPNGQAEIKLYQDATPEQIKIYEQYNQVRKNTKISIPMPKRLDIQYPVKLEQLRDVDSGNVAGGKATGQGELARLFPGRLPKAIVLPFGIYYQHLLDSGLYESIKKDLSDPALNGNSRQAFERRQKVFEKIRSDIMRVELKPDLVLFLAELLLKNPFKGLGFFVRSDTNAEDLAEFVGAGLNETIPNVKGLHNIIEAVKKVWASPFTEKAYTWRQDLIKNPWDIFPSVLIQAAVPADKAGIMVVGSPTEDDVDDVVYLASNEGLGLTAVGGLYVSEEVIVKRKSGEYVKLRSAYADKRKVPSTSDDGGVDSVPVIGMENVLSQAEAKELAALGDEIQKHMQKEYSKYGKWDVEWAIAQGKIYLVQVRPFIGNKVLKNVASLKSLEWENPATDAKTANILPTDRIIHLIEN